MTMSGSTILEPGVIESDMSSGQKVNDMEVTKDDAMEVDGPEIGHGPHTDDPELPTTNSKIDETKGPEQEQETIGGPLIIDLDEDEKLETSDIKIDSTKKPKDDKIDLPNTSEFRKIVKKMSREALEQFIEQSVVECFHAKSTASGLRNRVTTLNTQKDKLEKKCTLLQNQVTELCRSIKQLTETYARNPQENPNRAFVPLKFYRNVAMSVNMDSSPTKSASAPPQRNGTVRSCPNPIRIGPAATTVVAANGPIPSPSTTMNSTTTTNVANGPVKRVNKPTISVTELRNQVQNDQNQNKIARKVGPSSVTRVTSTAQIPVVKGPTPVVNVKAVPNGPIQTVDLTDDTPSTAPTPTTVTLTASTQSPLILNNYQNGQQVRYQVINAPSTATVKIVQSGSSYQLVTPTPDGPKQLVFQQQPVRNVAVSQANQPRPSTGQVVFRAVNSGTAARPVGNTATRQPIPTQRVMGPRGPVTISGVQANKNGTSPQPGTGVVVRPKSPYAMSTGPAVIKPIVVNSPKKFVLPDLPASAPVNNNPNIKRNKEAPPRPNLTLTQQNQSIVLSWTHDIGSIFAEIVNYQIYSCQEPLANAPSNTPVVWKRVGDVKALPLPMACTLSQFTEENRYYFIVRGVDVYTRTGLFCEPQSIVLEIKK